MEAKRNHQLILWLIIAALLATVAIPVFLGQPTDVKTIPYSEFQKLAAEGKLTDIVVGSTQITGRFKEPADKNVPRFATNRVDPALARALTKDKLAFSGESSSWLFSSALGWLIPAVLFVGLWMFLIRPMTGQGTGGFTAVGKSKAKIYAEKDIETTFADVAGVDEAKDELKEIVSFLKDPLSYGRLGARVPKGVLLVGPPGTGKTLLARAVAGEAGVAFFSISGSEFVELFVGVGAARVRDLFERAREHAPAIVFIDELDALGRARGSGLPGGASDEKEQTLNQVLSEMDGFDPSVGIVLLAATNRPEILDPALLRAGRFDRQVLVDRPDKKGRIEILKVHLKKVRAASDVPVEEVAAMTPGFTGADLANLVNEAAILATRRAGEEIILDDFTRAIERIVAGLEKRNRLLNPHERDVVAHHEMGHALVAMSLPRVDPVQKVSIIPRGIAALGYTIQRPLEDRFLMDRTELMNRMTVLLGGRAAESLTFEEVSTGAADDLAKATEIARGMVVRFGMDETLGQVTYEPEAAPFLGAPGGADWRPRHYADVTAAAIDSAMRGLIDAAFRKAVAILTANHALLNEAAKELVAKETFFADDLRAIAEKVSRPGACDIAPVGIAAFTPAA